MSVYRYNNLGSWSIRNNSDKARISIIKAKCKFLNNADIYSNYEYHEVISQIIDRNIIELLLLENNFGLIKSKYSHILNSDNKLKIKYFLGKYCPFLLRIVKKYKFLFRNNTFLKKLFKHQ